MDRLDKALLAAYLIAAGLGTWQQCLLVNDGVVYLAAAWLGNAWDLYFSQFVGRPLPTLAAFGPAWAVRAIFGVGSDAFLILAHVLYFAVPLILWLIVRQIERERMLSSLYLAVALALVYFPTEQIVGIGLWMVWLALAANPLRSTPTIVVATALLGLAMVFCHPALMPMSVLYLATGLGLGLFGRAPPKRSLVAAAGLSALLLIGYFVTSRWFTATNPTMLVAFAAGRGNYLDPAWLLATLLLFPVLAAFWLLLLAPGTVAARLRWRFSPAAVTIVALIGLWFAAAGTGLLTWLYARNTAPYVLAIVVALALVSPATWRAAAQQALMFYAAIAAVAAISYNADLFLYGQFIDRHLKPGVTDVEADGSWPPPLAGTYGARGYLKWFAGEDYQRDIVVPIYDWYRLTLAFQSYFRSGRTGVLFHPLNRRGDWLPFECPAVDRARARPHDAGDEMFLAFLSQNYCVR